MYVLTKCVAGVFFLATPDMHRECMTTLLAYFKQTSRMIAHMNTSVCSTVPLVHLISVSQHTLFECWFGMCKSGIQRWLNVSILLCAEQYTHWLEFGLAEQWCIRTCSCKWIVVVSVFLTVDKLNSIVIVMWSCSGRRKNDVSFPVSHARVQCQLCAADARRQNR